MAKTLKTKILVEEKREAVLLLRFHTEKPDVGAERYLSYSRISKVVCLTYNQVQHICVRALSPTKR